MATYFPPDLDKRAFVIFTCDRDNATIALPIPASMQFSDGATYNNTELGFIGGSLSNMASTISNQGLNREAIGNALGNEFTRAKNAYEGASIGSIIQGITALSGAGDTIQSAMSIATGTTVNKNITSEFTSINTRVFNFQFQLIPQSGSESDTIKKIVKTFREGLYPESMEYQLKYPPKWTIKFEQKGGGAIDHLPKIGETYLTEVNTTFNSTGNIWRSDGSPLETQLQVQFMETKAYTYETIKGL